MAFVYVTEYSQLGMYENVQIPQEPYIADYSIAIAVGTTVGPVFNIATRFVRIHADAVCSIRIAPAVPSPTVAATNQRFAAGQTEFKGVPQNAGYCVANITNT
jgi:hypothetical protein